MASESAMADGEDRRPAGSGVLKRLLQARIQAAECAGKPPQLPATVPPTPARAAATAIGRAADRLYGLGVRPVDIRPGALTLAELPELLPDPALLAVLQGPGDAVGVMALCPETVTALIEIQTIGRVTGRPLAKRRLTRSDATLCAEFVDTFLAELGCEGHGIEGLEQFQGFRYATYIDDSRPLALMMEDRAYRSLGMKVLLGGRDLREGQVFLALPQPRLESARLRHEASKIIGAVAAASAKPSSAATLLPQMQEAPVEVMGILCRRRMSLQDLRNLTPGKLLALPRVSLSDARLETPDGQLLAVGKFGESDGCHAIRLRDPDAAVTDPVAAPAPTVSSEGHGGLPIGDINKPDAFRRDPSGSAQIDPLAFDQDAKAS